jgi:transposase
MESTTQTQSAVEEKAVPGGAARLMRKVKQATRRKITAEQKIRIVLEGFRKEIAVSELCRRERISPAIYYSWLKEFMEAGKDRLLGNTLRNATSEEVARLKQENRDLKELLGEQALELALFKKRLLG